MGFSLRPPDAEPVVSTVKETSSDDSCCSKSSESEFETSLMGITGIGLLSSPKVQGLLDKISWTANRVISDKNIVLAFD